MLLKKSSDSKKFILANGGHISALISPPSSIKDLSYKFVINEEQSIQDTLKYKGSWWICWKNWLIHFDNEKIAANLIYPNNKDHKKLNLNYEKAPGKYILIKAGC